MFTPITFPTALFFWLSYINKRHLPILSNLPERLSEPPFRKDPLLSVLQDYDLEPPFHIMVPKSSLRHRGAQFISHVMPANLPRGSFVRLSDSVFIISPELCFLLAASYLSIPDLVVLGCDLCGIYARAEWSEFKQVSRTPVTTAEQIQAYLKKACNIGGMKNARIAAGFILNQSNSPMESKLAAASVLRYYYGGFSFERPLLNENIPMSSSGAEVIGLDHLCCDIVWPSKHLIVEYDSDLAHLNKNRFYFDKKRTNALVLSGYKVITAIRDDFRNINTIEKLFSLISKSLKKKINKKDFEASEPARRELIKHLFLTTDSLNWFRMFSF